MGEREEKYKNEVGIDEDMDGVRMLDERKRR
jgi:hypothetical protein